LWNLKDSWYSTEINADPGDILPASVMKNKSHLKQQKGEFTLILWISGSKDDTNLFSCLGVSCYLNETYHLSTS
jgi:hypothetical protein